MASPTAEPKFLTSSIPGMSKPSLRATTAKTLPSPPTKRHQQTLPAEHQDRKIQAFARRPSRGHHRDQLPPNGRDLAFNLTSSRSPLDVYSIDIQTNQIARWTESEIGGLNAASFVEPSLVTWKSFDGKEISGFFISPT